jgi:hypothetical protein
LHLHPNDLEGCRLQVLGLNGDKCTLPTCYLGSLDYIYWKYVECICRWYYNGPLSWYYNVWQTPQISLASIP